MPDFKQVEYMALPRMAALSEILWSTEKRKNQADFLVRLRYHVAMLDRLGVHYAKHFLLKNDVR
jgi:hexosaminidase